MTDLSKDLDRLNIKELLALLKGAPYFSKITNTIKEAIKNRIYTNKPFLSQNINEQEVQSLYQISKRDIYKRMESCLGSHWSMNLIALGLYISELNEMGQRDLQARVRFDVHTRYGAKGLRILEMGSTNAIKTIIDYLSGIKMTNDYNFLQMGRLFDKIIEEWSSITIFVESEDNLNHVEVKCLEMIRNKKPLFFVFAYGSAVRHAIFAIAKLNNNGDLKGYIFKGETRKVGVDKKMEVYSCPFENIEGFGIYIFA